MMRRVLLGALGLLLPTALVAQSVAEVQVAPPSVTIRAGERAGLLATAFDRIGNVIPTVRIIWSSNNVNIAKVDNNGTVTGVANGVAIIEARVGARRGQAAIQVTGGASLAPPPAPPPGPPAPPSRLRALRSDQTSRASTKAATSSPSRLARVRSRRPTPAA